MTATTHNDAPFVTINGSTSAYFYGDGGTIHHTNHVDVEVHDGKVVSVWFRCALMPFKQVDVDAQRADQMRASGIPPVIRGVIYDTATVLTT